MVGSNVQKILLLQYQVLLQTEQFQNLSTSVDDLFGVVSFLDQTGSGDATIH
jgi:hypothetical protein